MTFSLTRCSRIPLKLAFPVYEPISLPVLIIALGFNSLLQKTIPLLEPGVAAICVAPVHPHDGNIERSRYYLLIVRNIPLEVLRNVGDHCFATDARFKLYFAGSLSMSCIVDVNKSDAKAGEMRSYTVGSRGRKIVVALLTATILSGCASQATLAYRDGLRAECKAGGKNACDILPMVEERASQEASENGAKIAGGILLGVAAAADAYSESRRPTYVYVRACRWC